MSHSSGTPVWQGVCLVAGGAIGAGMFALPLVSAGAWMIWSAIGLFLVWLMSYLSSMLLAHVNLALSENTTDLSTAHQQKISFDSIVTRFLGSKWALWNNISIAFIFVVLMYAYSTASSQVVKSLLSVLSIDVSGVPDFSLRLGFMVFFAVVVWLGAHVVSRLNVLLMLMMVALFFMATFGLTDSLDHSSVPLPADAYQYIPASIPVYVTAFACAGLVPTLVQLFHGDKSKVRGSLFWGTLLTLCVYLFWLFIVFGAVEREAFSLFPEQGNRIEQLAQAMTGRASSETLYNRLTLFSHIAILTSFLAISLSLVHFIRDKLQLTDNTQGNLLATFLSFAPPTFASLTFPYGFTYAIGLAGLFVAFSFFILPGLLYNAAESQSLLSGRRKLTAMVISFGILIVGLKLLLIFGVLPVY